MNSIITPLSVASNESELRNPERPDIYFVRTVVRSRIWPIIGLAVDISWNWPWDWSRAGRQIDPRRAVRLAGPGLTLGWPWPGPGPSLVFPWCVPGLALVWAWSGPRMGAMSCQRFSKKCWRCNTQYSCHCSIVKLWGSLANIYETNSFQKHASSLILFPDYTSYC